MNYLYFILAIEELGEMALIFIFTNFTKQCNNMKRFEQYCIDILVLAQLLTLLLFILVNY